MKQFFFEHRLVWVSKQPNKDDQNTSSSQNIEGNSAHSKKTSLRPQKSILKNTELVHQNIEAVTKLIKGKTEVSEKEVQEVLGKISEDTKRSIQRGGLSTAEILKRKIINEVARSILAEQAVDPNLIDIIESDPKMQSSLLYTDLIRGYKKEKGKKAVQKIVEKAERVAMQNMKIPKSYQDYVLKNPHLLKKIIGLYQEFYYSELNNTQKFDIKISWELEIAEIKDQLAKCQNEEERAAILNKADRSLINTGALSLEKILKLDSNEQKKVIDTLVETEVEKHKQQKNNIITSVKKEVKNSYLEDSICQICHIDQEFFLPRFTAHLPEESAQFFHESKQIIQKKLGSEGEKSAIVILWKNIRNSLASEQLLLLKAEYKSETEYFASIYEHWLNLQDDSFNEEDRNFGLMRLVEESARLKFLKQHPEFAEAQKEAIEKKEIMDRPSEAKKVIREIDEHLEIASSQKIVANLSKKKTSITDLQETLGLLVTKNMLKLVPAKAFNTDSKGVAKRPAYYDIDHGIIVVNQDDPLVQVVLEKIQSPNSAVGLKGVKDPINVFSSLLLHEVTHHKVAEHYSYYDAFLERAKQAFEQNAAAASPEKLRAMLIQLMKEPDAANLNFWQKAIVKEFETKYQNDIRGQCYKLDGTLETKYRDLFEKAIKLWPEKKFDLSKTGVERIIDELEACAAEYQKGTIKLEPPAVQALVKDWLQMRSTDLAAPSGLENIQHNILKGIAASPGGSESDEDEDQNKPETTPAPVASSEEVGVQTKAVNPRTLKAQLEDALKPGKEITQLNEYAQRINDTEMTDQVKEIEQSLMQGIDYIKQIENDEDLKKSSRVQAKLISIRDWYNEVAKNASHVKELMEATDKNIDKGILASLWGNTRFLSIYDIKQIYAQIKEWVERRMKSSSQMKVGNLGSNMFKDLPFLTGLAQEFKRTDQAAQNSEVDIYQQAYKEFDLDDLYAEARSPKNVNSLKAVYLTLVSMGMMQGLLNDEAAWNALAKFSGTSVYNSNTALTAMDTIWGRPTGSNWLLEDSNNLGSKATSQVSILKGNADLKPKYLKWIDDARNKKDKKTGKTTRVFNLPEIMGHVRADIEYAVTPVDELMPLVMELILEGAIPDYAVSTMTADLMNKAPIHAIVSLSEAKKLGIYGLWFNLYEEGAKKGEIIMNSDGTPSFNEENRKIVKDFFAGKRLLPLPFNPDTASPDKVVIADQKYMVSVGQLLARRSRTNMRVDALKDIDSSQVQYYTPYLSWNNLTSTYGSANQDGNRGIKPNAYAAAVKGPIAEFGSLLESADQMSPAKLKYALKEQMRRMLMLIEYFKRYKTRPFQDVAELVSYEEMRSDSKRFPGGINDTNYKEHIKTFKNNEERQAREVGAMKANAPAWTQEALLDFNIVIYAQKLQEKIDNITHKYNFSNADDHLDIMEILEDVSSASPLTKYYEKSMKCIDKYVEKIAKQ